MIQLELPVTEETTFVLFIKWSWNKSPNHLSGTGVVNIIYSAKIKFRWVTDLSLKYKYKIQTKPIAIIYISVC